MTDAIDSKTVDIESVGEVVPVLRQSQSEGLESTQLTALVDAKAKSQVQFSEQIGQVRAFDFQRKVSWVAMLKLLDEIQLTRAYKGMSLTSHAGEVVTVQTWEDFYLAATGYSRAKVDSDLQTLQTLGEEFMQTAREMKLAHRDILKLRKLPEDDRAIVMGNIEVSVGDKTAIVELIDELSQKHAKEKTALETELEKATKRVDAVVAEETKALKKEVDALVQERDALKDQVEEPRWTAAREKAVNLADSSLEVRKSADRVMRIMPKNEEIPPDLLMLIESSIYSALHSVSVVHEAWVALNDEIKAKKQAAFEPAE